MREYICYQDNVTMRLLVTHTHTHIQYNRLSLLRDIAMHAILAKSASHSSSTESRLQNEHSIVHLLTTDELRTSQTTFTLNFNPI